MSRAIIIQRISRRTGVVGTPRAIRTEKTIRLEEGENPAKVARALLPRVKKQTAKDGNDRQIEYV